MSWPNIQISSYSVIFAGKLRLFSILTTLACTTLKLLCCGYRLLSMVVTDHRTVRPWAPSPRDAANLKSIFGPDCTQNPIWSAKSWVLCGKCRPIFFLFETRWYGWKWSPWPILRLLALLSSKKRQSLKITTFFVQIDKITGGGLQRPIYYLTQLIQRLSSLPWALGYECYLHASRFCWRTRSFFSGGTGNALVTSIFPVLANTQSTPAFDWEKLFGS